MYIWLRPLLIPFKATGDTIVNQGSLGGTKGRSYFIRDLIAVAVTMAEKMSTIADISDNDRVWKRRARTRFLDHRINEKSGVEFLETAVQTLSQDAMQLYDVRLVSDLRSVDVVVVVVINVKVEALECV